MPICEADAWRLQYFAHVTTAAQIPTEDGDAWLWYPAQRWIYNKLAIALSQGLDAGPHGTVPPRFPVFSKPIINLKGMGVGSRILRSAQEYERHSTSGHFWSTLLEGPHVSSDLAVVDGVPRWWRHVTGQPRQQGTFDYWTIQADPEPDIETRCGDWVRRHLAGYTGMLNLETIGGRIIEAHLRFADQWPDLQGRGWVEAVVRLYAAGVWEFADDDRRDGFSVVLFGPHGRDYRPPPHKLLDEVLHMPSVSSVQITFHADKPAAAHAMPPGGFRLAVVNCWDLAHGKAARERLSDYFLPP